jgi:hypothetical protein
LSAAAVREGAAMKARARAVIRRIKREVMWLVRRLGIF